MRAFWSSLIVVCLLVVPARPSQAEVREHDHTSSTSEKVGVAGRHGVVAPMARRTCTGPTHTQLPFIAPEVALDARPTRTTALVSLRAPSRAPDSSIVLTHSARGPPCG